VPGLPALPPERCPQGLAAPELSPHQTERRPVSRSSRPMLDLAAHPPGSRPQRLKAPSPLCLPAEESRQAVLPRALEPGHSPDLTPELEQHAAQWLPRASESSDSQAQDDPLQTVVVSCSPLVR
jgi:hypothetical protein